LFIDVVKPNIFEKFMISYPAPMYPDVTTDSPGPRKRHVKLNLLSLLV
jgi:hypothetical protein